MRLGHGSGVVMTVLAALFMISVVIVALPVSDCISAEVTIDGLVYETFGDGTAAIVGHDGELSEIDIPRSITVGDVVYEVTFVSPSAFEGCDQVTKVVIGPGIQNLAGNPFWYCESLSGILVDPDNRWYKVMDGMLLTADGKTVISGSAYEGTGVMVPDGVEMIGTQAFRGSTIESLVLPDSVTQISGSAFQDCMGLYGVDLGDGVGHIGNTAFGYCESLVSIDLTGTVILNASAFKNCTSLEEVVLGPELDTMDGNPFGGCTSLTEVMLDPMNPHFDVVDGVMFTEGMGTLVVFPSGISGDYIIPDGTLEVGSEAFEESLVESVIVSDSVTCIGSVAFYGCEELIQIDFGEGVDTILDGAFSGCTSLGSVVIPDRVTSLEGSVFAYCDSLESVDLGSGVKSIRDGVFTGTALTSIHIPANVLSVYPDSFHYCESFESYDVHPDNPVYADVDGVLFSKNISVLVSYPFSVGGTYVVPEGVVAIANDAFYEGSISGIEFPSTLRTIGDFAFAGNWGLTDLVLPEGLETIGACAFGGCIWLENLVLPDSLKTIDTGAFGDCTSLRAFTIPDGVVIDDGAFTGVCGVDDEVVPVSGSTIGHNFVDHECTVCGEIEFSFTYLLYLFAPILLFGSVLIVIVALLLRRKRREF